MNEMIATADAFADAAHVLQKRKYTGEPYIVHPREVASIVMQYFPGWTPEMACAALLHDVVEDCGVKFQTIEKVFGREVRNLVFWLSDCIPKEMGNRAQRKELQTMLIGNAPWQAQIVKLADIMSNAVSIAEHDPDFAVKFRQECTKGIHVIMGSRSMSECPHVNAATRMANEALTRMGCGPNELIRS